MGEEAALVVPVPAAPLTLPEQRASQACSLPGRRKPRLLGGRNTGRCGRPPPHHDSERHSLGSLAWVLVLLEHKRLTLPSCHDPLSGFIEQIQAVLSHHCQESPTRRSPAGIMS
jgi:hypothetical protein